MIHDYDYPVMKVVINDYDYRVINNYDRWTIETIEANVIGHDEFIHH